MAKIFGSVAASRMVRRPPGVTLRRAIMARDLRAFIPPMSLTKSLCVVGTSASPTATPTVDAPMNSRKSHRRAVPAPRASASSTRLAISGPRKPFDSRETSTSALNNAKLIAIRRVRTPAISRRVGQSPDEVDDEREQEDCNELSVHGSVPWCGHARPRSSPGSGLRCARQGGRPMIDPARIFALIPGRARGQAAMPPTDAMRGVVTARHRGTRLPIASRLANGASGRI